MKGDPCPLSVPCSGFYAGAVEIHDEVMQSWDLCGG